MQKNVATKRASKFFKQQRVNVLRNTE